MENLASTYKSQKRWKDAEKLELELQVLETNKTALGDNHPDTLTIAAHLVRTYGTPRSSQGSQPVVSCA
jgi:hypothetical protein